MLPESGAVVTTPGMLALAESTAAAAVKQPEKVAATRQEIFQGESCHYGQKCVTSEPANC